jgi:hypothetical protein
MRQEKNNESAPAKKKRGANPQTGMMFVSSFPWTCQPSSP